MTDVPTSNSSAQQIPESAEFAPQDHAGHSIAAPKPTSDQWRTQPWQKQLSNCIRSSAQLCAALDLDHPEIADNDFPVMVPESFLARMQPNCPTDPLLLQVLTSIQEDNLQEGFRADPVGDAAAKKADGLLQKYHGRALLITTGSCAVHCRYCFRREYPYQSEPKTLNDWQPAIDAISNDRTVQEVILSGGDPLLLTDVRLLQLMKALDQIAHVDRIRIHTRLPIVLPARITPELISKMKQLRSQVIWVVHSNHANEIQDDCLQTLQSLVSAGFPVLNQAVLLKDINDNLDALKELSLSLVNIGVMPYYLHQLDRVTGAAHFEVPVTKGRTLIQQLKTVLPGYAVPKYVQEIQAQPSKTAL